MEYRCRLGTASGEVIEGVYVAESEARLRRDLEDKGLYVLTLRQRGLLAGQLALPRRRRIATREFLIFNQELATLIRAGMPLVQSLDILRQRIPNQVFRSVLDDVYERVRGGAALSEAFDAQGPLFPPIYTASLVAGEKSGNLEGVLRRYVSHVKVITAVRKKTTAALMYPVILMTLAVGLVGILVLRVVPQFSDFYATFDRELPVSTRFLVSTSDIIRRNLLVISLMVIAGVTTIWYWVQQPANHARLDRALLALGWVGRTARKFATAQLARTLATLLGGGIPLVQSLEIAARSISNRYLAAELSTVAQRVREGEPLAVALSAKRLVPDVAIKMVEVGESTGALQDMLNSLADFYDEELETDLGRFVTLVEPVLLVVMGIIIAGLLLALYFPLFQLSSVVSS